jgi:hypothetical protein
MKTPIPLSELAEIFDVCKNSPILEVIRNAFKRPGVDLVKLAEFALDCVQSETDDALAVEALHAYALHESGLLASTGARLHHRGRFYRCYRKIKVLP